MKNFLKIPLLTLFIFLGMVLSTYCLADTLQTFESLSLGDACGQTGIACTGTTTAQIQTSIASVGRALDLTTVSPHNSYVRLSFPGIASIADVEQWQFYLYGSVGSIVYFIPYDESGNTLWVSVESGGTLYNYGYTTSKTLTLNDWNKIDVEIDHTLHKMRCQVNNGGFSSWRSVNPNSDTTEFLDVANSVSNAHAYIDNISLMSDYTITLPPDESYVNFVVPDASSTSALLDFPNWQVIYHSTASTTSATKLIVYYWGTGSTTMPLSFDSEVVPLGFTEPVSWSLIKSVYLTDGTYTAQAEIMSVDSCDNETPPNCQTTSLALSAETAFTIDNLGGQDPYSATTTLNDMNATCDPKSGLFQYSLCKLFQFLFVPSNKIKARYSSLWDKIKFKQPFGYFYSGISEFSKITYENGTGAIYDFFSPIRELLKYCLYFLCLFYLIKQILKIQT